MARTATLEATDPAVARSLVINRVLDRVKPPKVSFQIDQRNGETVRIEERSVGDRERLAPVDVGEWCDDRVVACFGGRVRLNPVEQVAFEVIEAMRTGDAAATAAVVRKASGGLDDMEAHMIWPLLEQWRGGAPLCALAVAEAALNEARRLGWDQRPSERKRRQLAAARAKAAQPA